MSRGECRGSVADAHKESDQSTALFGITPYLPHLIAMEEERSLMSRYVNLYPAFILVCLSFNHEETL